MVHEFRSPIPVTTPLGKGFAIYVDSSGTFENDIWTVALKDGGRIQHFTSIQLTIDANGTFEITNQ